MMKKTLTVLALACGVAAANAVPSSILFDSLSNSVVSTVTVGGTGEDSLAQEFDMGSSSATVVSVDVQVDSGSGGGFELSLYTDAFGSVPGTDLETFTGTADPSGGGLFTYTATLSHEPLSANGHYWIVASDTTGSYSLSTVGSITTGSSSLGGLSEPTTGVGSGTWSAIDGTLPMEVVLPEPSTIALAGMGVVGILGLRRKK